MWGLPFVFWMLLIAFLVLRGPRRWHRLLPPWEREDAEPGLRREDDVQLLEVRIARLEERLDFTEKLLMERGKAADAP